MRARSASATAIAPPEPPSPIPQATVGTLSRAIVACQLEPVIEQALYVVERMRPLIVARGLDVAPDVLVGRLLTDAGDLPLEPLELAGKAGPAGQRQVPQSPEPLAKPQLVLTQGH